jgi:hypothetical protein
MKNIYYYLIFILLCSCAPTRQLTPAQIRSMTTTQYDADYETTYRSAISLLQSEGFLIEASNRKDGLINASKRIDNKNAAAQRFWYGASKDASLATVVFYIEELYWDLTEVKLTIYAGSISSSLSYWGSKSTDTKSSMVQNPKIYDNWFYNLEVEIERRKALR